MTRDRCPGVRSAGQKVFLLRLARSLLAVGWLLTSLACERADLVDETDSESETSDPAPRRALPPLELRDDTPNLLLTWIDDGGDFHVVESTREVPREGRERVRVVITTERDGTEELLYVANLVEARGDGTYPVRTMPRSEWDALGAEKRKKRLEELAPSPDPPADPEPEATPAGDGKLVAIIYGADWCRPCHQAEHLLRQLGVEVTKKDIEEDPGASREMRTKLSKIGRAGGSIPVIDLGGQIFVGFSAPAIKRAVEAMRSAVSPRDP
jgi:glutaredoxin